MLYLKRKQNTNGILNQFKRELKLVITWLIKTKEIPKKPDFHTKKKWMICFMMNFLCKQMIVVDLVGKK